MFLKVYKGDIKIKTEQIKNAERQKNYFLKRIGRKWRLIKIRVEQKNDHATNNAYTELRPFKKSYHNLSKRNIWS